MKIENLKDLERLIKLCRKTGVRTISADGVTIELEDVEVIPPFKSIKKDKGNQAATGDDPLATPIDMPDALSEEELLFYSVSGQRIPGEGQ